MKIWLTSSYRCSRFCWRWDSINPLANDQLLLFIFLPGFIHCASRLEVGGGGNGCDAYWTPMAEIPSWGGLHDWPLLYSFAYCRGEIILYIDACYSDEFGQDGTMIESSTVSAVDGTIHRMRPVAPLLHHSTMLHIAEEIEPPFYFPIPRNTSRDAVKPLVRRIFSFHRAGDWPLEHLPRLVHRHPVVDKSLCSTVRRAERREQSGQLAEYRKKKRPIGQTPTGIEPMTTVSYKYVRLVDGLVIIPISPMLPRLLPSPPRLTLVSCPGQERWMANLRGTVRMKQTLLTQSPFSDTEKSWGEGGGGAGLFN